MLTDTPRHDDGRISPGEPARVAQTPAGKDILPACSILELGDGERMRVTARDPKARPEVLLWTGEHACRPFALRKASSGEVARAITAAIRENAAEIGLADLLATGPRTTVAYAIGRRFAIEHEVRCLKCAGDWVCHERSWGYLREALAPPAFKEGLARGCSAIRIFNRTLGDRKQVEAWITGTKDPCVVEARLDERLEYLEPVLCRACWEEECAWLVGVAGRRREDIEEQSHARKKARESIAQAAPARLESEISPFITVAAKPWELGAHVNPWLMRGYRLWGTPHTRDDLVYQYLVRPEALPEIPGLRSPASSPSQGSRETPSSQRDKARSMPLTNVPDSRCIEAARQQVLADIQGITDVRPDCRLVNATAHRAIYDLAVTAQALQKVPLDEPLSLTDLSTCVALLRETASLWAVPEHRVRYRSLSQALEQYAKDWDRALDAHCEEMALSFAEELRGSHRADR